MKFEEWRPIYYGILKDFGYSEELDRKSAVLLHDMAGNKLLEKSVLYNKIKNKKVAVIGLAIKKIEFESIKEDVIITAGKALEVVKNISPAFIPDVHVTDMEEDFSFLDKKCILVLHAHGDNIEKIKSKIPKISKFVGTTQSEPFNKIYNFGGFTDGDRAALIAKEMGAKEIKLYGFDFEKATGIKKRKLFWSKRILRIYDIN